MNTSRRNRIDHWISFAISMLLNGGLIFAFIMMMTQSTPPDPDQTVALVLNPVDEIVIDDLEMEILREDFTPEDLADLNFDTDFNFEVEFSPEMFVDPIDPAPVIAETQINQLSELLSDIASPVVMHGIMPGRTALQRQAALSRFADGMGDQTEAAVQRALRWLASVQNQDGGWNAAGNPRARGGTGWTGLALLTFLSNGQTPASAEFGSTVSRAIRNLVESQQSNGIIWTPGSSHETYAHAIATYALAEAFTMTGNILLREPVRRAAEVMVRYQLPDGGFRGPSGYRFAGNGISDNSVTAWNIQAMKAVLIASQVHGFEVTGLDRALQRGMDAMLGMSFMHNGELHFGYTPRNPRRLDSLVTEAAALCLMLTGRADTREARNVINHISRHIPTWGTTHKRTYGGAINMWYYAIQAIFHMDPDSQAFRRYNRGMVTALLQNQSPAGYWMCFTADGQRHGPVFNTTLGALGLMVYYRFLPTTQADRFQPAPSPAASPDEDLIRIVI